MRSGVKPLCVPAFLVSAREGDRVDLQQNLESMTRRYSRPQIVAIWGHNQENGLLAAERTMIEAWCPNRTLSFLCVGCGGGREVFALLRLGYEKVVGLEPSPALLLEARKYAAAHDLRPPLLRAEASHLPYDAESFDVVTMFENVYGHITPHDARLRSLAEARRVLRPGGLVLMYVTSLHNHWYYRWSIAGLDVLRRLYNPQRMERGDKRMRGEKHLTTRGSGFVARSHWFRPDDVPHDAAMTALEVALTSTVAGVVDDPRGNSDRLVGRGRLVYVLRRPIP